MTNRHLSARATLHRMHFIRKDFVVSLTSLCSMAFYILRFKNKLYLYHTTFRCLMTRCWILNSKLPNKQRQNMDICPVLFLQRHNNICFLWMFKYSFEFINIRYVVCVFYWKLWFIHTTPQLLDGSIFYLLYRP